MLTAAVVVAGGTIFLALLVYAGFLAARYFFLPGQPDEIHFARTSDGWRIAVFRYRPSGPADGAKNGQSPTEQAPGDPLLLVPGIGANHYNFDLTDDTALARYLAASGHDVWVVELRGRGLSTRPRLFSGLHYDWSFDEYAERDLPAAAALVTRVTGRARLHLIGFSTGALAAYA